ncbi:MAG: type II toxin-antitoxin system VapC family toxin [Allorhizobium sp.]
MSGYLLDTDVLSLLSPGRVNVPERFEAWVEAQERAGQIYLSAVSIHEIEKGIRLLEAKGSLQKARALEVWLRPLETRLADFVLPVDAEVARVSGALEAKAIAEGANPGASDAMIAGTATFHALTLVTRNLRHFRAFGIGVMGVEQVTG